jgi:CDP-paratose 2-epimerase
VLVTGGAGFVGTNLADRLLCDGRSVRILDDLSRPGVERNLAWLVARHGPALDVEVADVCDAGAVARAAERVSTIFHLAGQVAVTTSLDDPLRDAAVNLQGTLNVLEAARAQARPPAVVFTSTNKVYGSLPDVPLVERASRYAPADRRLAATGVGESRPLSFRTPYGCSKGAADQYVLDYGASFGVPTVVFRMSCIYGPHQFGTEDQGWVAHFLISALRGRPITIYGDGKQVRDVLFVDDLVEALVAAAAGARELAGSAFNIGGGPGRTLSLLELVALLRDEHGHGPRVQLRGWRHGDQRYYVSDTSRFTAATGWEPRVAPAEGVARLHRWLAENEPAAGRARQEAAA